MNEKSKNSSNTRLKDDFTHALLMLRNIQPHKISFALSVPAFVMLKSLKQREEKGEVGGTWISEMKDYLCVSKAAVSQLLSSLESKGLVTRETDSKDRRSIIVRLTPKGAEMIERIERNFDASIDMLINRIGEEDTREMIRLIYRIKDIIPEIQNEIEARSKE